MSNNEQLFIFGSFTVDETKQLQNPAAKSVALPEKVINLQFGSLALSSFKVPQDLDTIEKNKRSVPFISKEGTEKEKHVNGDTSITRDLEMISSTHSNGSTVDSHHLEKSIREKEIVTEAEYQNKADKKSDNGVSTVERNSFEIEVCVESKRTLASKVDFDRRLNGGIEVKGPVPRGLINSGNLCFRNATLQALLSCSPFVELLEDLRARNIPKIGYPTLEAFIEFIGGFDFLELSSPKKHEGSVLRAGPSFNPVMFDGILKNFSPDLPSINSNLGGRPRQEDAQEFLSFIMDQTHDELLKLKGFLSDAGDSSKCSLVSSVEEDGWETVGPKNKSAITRTQAFLPSELSDIFGGQTRSVVKSRGNKASATVQPFLLLHLDIFPDTVRTIEDALHLFSAPETLEDYKTLGGKGQAGEVSAKKSVKIQTLPKIMILHLMRFSYGARGSAKLHKPVHFLPELVLQRELLVSPSSGGRRYELVATITHHGREPSRGHYTADAKCSNGRWIRYDDATVSCVDLGKVLHDQGYILFYKQLL